MFYGLGSEFHEKETKWVFVIRRENCYDDLFDSIKVRFVFSVNTCKHLQWRFKKTQGRTRTLNTLIWAISLTVNVLTRNLIAINKLMKMKAKSLLMVLFFLGDIGCRS